MRAHATRPGLARRRLSRRALLAASLRASVGVAALALAGCGGDDDDADGDATNGDDGVGEMPPAGTGAALRPERAPPAQAPDPAPPPSFADGPPPTGPPQPGGTLQLAASLSELDFFDIHRSRLVSTQLFSALQQSKLLRYADIDSGELEGDLAALPEVPDEETYVFVLRPGVRWWDHPLTGARSLTADDVRANIERQIAAVDASGAADPLFLRQSLYAETASLQVVDAETIVLRTDGPNALYPTVTHAGPWAFIQAPEVWRIYGERLRDDPLDRRYYTGSGPFRVGSFRPGRLISFQRNQSYFRAQRPYLDSVTVVHLVSAAEQEAAYREGRLDLWSPGDPRAVQPVLADLPDHRVAERPLPFGIQMAMSFRRGPANPLQDTRLARALHLALDRHALMGRAYGSHGRLSGAVPWFTGWAMAEPELLQQPGYSARLSDAQRKTIRDLVAAAQFEGPLTLHLPATFAATYPGVDAELEATLGARLGIDVRTETAAYADIVEGLRRGTVSVFVGWGDAITDPDPTAHLLRTVHSDGADNWGGFAHPGVDAALERMRRAQDARERRRIFRDSVEPVLLERPSWVVNVGHGIQRTLHPPHVHLPRFGFGWDGHRYEDAWRQPPPP